MQQQLLHGQPATPMSLDSAKVFHLPGWGRLNDADRVRFIRQVAEQSGRDPRIRSLAVRILTSARVDPRDYEGQASALLTWVQHHVYYVNEPGEIIQDPWYTLNPPDNTPAHGDCDDLAALLGALYESIRLDYRFVLSGMRQGQHMRWVEGQPIPPGVTWAHIYVSVGWPPFNPTTWAFAEPTMKKPLGWDVHAAIQQGQRPGLPELGSFFSPGGAIASTALIGADESQGHLNWKQIAAAIVVGVLTSTVSAIVVDYVRRR